MLTQKEVGTRLGVVSWTITNWEKGHTQPPIASIAGIIRFLGYDPFPEPRTLPELLRAKRRAMGWSIERAAEVMSVDPGSWSKWERGKTVLYRQHRTRVAELLGLSINALDEDMSARWNRLHERDIGNGSG